MGLFKNKEKDTKSYFYFNSNTGMIDIEPGKGFKEFIMVTDEGGVTILDEEVFTHINKCLGHDMFHNVRDAQFYTEWLHMIYNFVISKNSVDTPKEGSLTYLWNNIETDNGYRKDKKLHEILTTLTVSLGEGNICDLALAYYDNSKISIIPIYTVNMRYLTSYTDNILLCRLICKLENISHSKVVGLANLTTKESLKIPALHLIGIYGIVDERLDSMYDTIDEELNILKENILDTRNREKFTKVALNKKIPGSNNKINFIEGNVVIRQKLTNNFNIISNMNSKINKLILKEDIPTIIRILECILSDALPRTSDLCICSLSYQDDKGDHKQLFLDEIGHNDI